MVTVDLVDTDLSAKVGGSLADLYDPVFRATAFAGFVSANSMGGIIEPISELLAMKKRTTNS